MNDMIELTKIDFVYVFFAVFIILIGIKAIVSVLEWTIDKLGLETKWMKQKREERELLFQTSQNLKDLKNKLSDSEKKRGAQIEDLMCGNKELLGAEIDRRYREYISLDGIPESEVDEFNDIYSAYKRLNGNHRRDAKYNYVKDHLSVIPVETTLVVKERFTC